MGVDFMGQPGWVLVTSSGQEVFPGSDCVVQDAAPLSTKVSDVATPRITFECWYGSGWAPVSPRYSTDSPPTEDRPLVTMEAWQAAAFFGEAMVGVEVSCGNHQDMWEAESEDGFGGWSRGAEITFPLPRVRYVPTEEQPDEPGVGEVWVSMAGNFVSLILGDGRTLEMWVEGASQFNEFGPEVFARDHNVVTRLMGTHARVRPVPADAVEVSDGRSVISGSSKQGIVQEGRLFDIYEDSLRQGLAMGGERVVLGGHEFRSPTVFHPEESLPEPTFDCSSCRDTGRRTYHDGRERDCGACGDGPCVGCDSKGLVVFACEHRQRAVEGSTMLYGQRVIDGELRFVIIRSANIDHDGITCLFASRPKLSVPIDNQADLAELLCPDA